MSRRASAAGIVGALTFVATALAAPGQLDAGFGVGGKIRTDLGGDENAAAVALEPNGAIAVAGASRGDVAVLRYDRSGRLDANFGSDGRVVTDLGGDDAADATVIDRDGMIVVAGKRDSDLALVKYAADGALDRRFGDGGRVVTDLGGEERAVALLRRGDGRLVLVGTSPDALVLARYLADGRLDRTFGRNGIVIRGTPGVEWRTAVAGRDGTIVAAGARIITAPTQGMGFAVARYRADGRPDRTFSGDGLTVTRTRPHWAGAVHVAVLRDARIVLGSHGHAGTRAGFALVRLERDGSLDRTFGNGGVAVGEVGFGVHALALDRRGRIVTVGRTTSLQDFVAARFLPNGRLDGSFARTVTDFGGTDTPFELALQPDGKIVAVGSTGASGSLLGDIAVARYLSSG